MTDTARAAEAAVLSAALYSPDSIPAMRRFVPDPAAFTVPAHRAAWGAILAIVDRGEDPDLVTVGAQAERDGAPRGVATALAEAASAPRLEGERYAAVVREHALRRSMASRLASVLRDCADPMADPFDTLEAVRAAYEAEVLGLPSSGMTTMAQALDTLEARRNEPDAAGLPCAVPGLSGLIGGWKPGKLYVGAGRPAMGKSSHAKSEALHVAHATGRTAAVFTLEMDADEYAERVEAEAPRYGITPDDLRKLPIRYDDSARLSTADVRAKLHDLARDLRARVEPPLGLVVVDYIQLMHGTGDNREQQVSQISRDLKAIAREFRVPVLGLSQLNRAVESRADKRPMLSDLRESGAIEQDADCVLFYYRPEYYGAEHAEVDGFLEPAEGLCEIIVGKQRGGPTGSAWAHFDAKRTAFSGRQSRVASPGVPGYSGDGHRYPAPEMDEPSF